MTSFFSNAVITFNFKTLLTAKNLQAAYNVCLYNTLESILFHFQHYPSKT